MGTYKDSFLWLFEHNIKPLEHLLIKNYIFIFNFRIHETKDD